MEVKVPRPPEATDELDVIATRGLKRIIESLVVGSEASVVSVVNASAQKDN